MSPIIVDLLVILEGRNLRTLLNFLHQFNILVDLKLLVYLMGKGFIEKCYFSTNLVPIERIPKQIQIKEKIDPQIKGIAPNYMQFHDRCIVTIRLLEIICAITYKNQNYIK